jgi:cell wall-associated NlpC family hydrolase
MRLVVGVLAGLAACITILVFLVVSVIAALPWLAGPSDGTPAVAQVQTQQPAAAAVGMPVPTPLPALSAAPGSSVEAMLAYARTWIGVPYYWGGCSKSGVDCSCFVRNVLAVLGINAPRVTTAQIQWATPISASQARAGDLVFFDNTCTGCGPNPTHVGMVLGGGIMIDAGDPVHIEPIYGGHNARYGRPPGL